MFNKIKARIKRFVYECQEAFTGMCSHRNECEYFDLKSFKCTQDAGPYCGTWKQFERENK